MLARVQAAKNTNFAVEINDLVLSEMYPNLREFRITVRYRSLFTPGLHPAQLTTICSQVIYAYNLSLRQAVP